MSEALLRQKCARNVSLISRAATIRGQRTTNDATTKMLLYHYDLGTLTDVLTHCSTAVHLAAPARRVYTHGQPSLRPAVSHTGPSVSVLPIWFGSADLLTPSRPDKRLICLTLSDVEERSVTDPCPWLWISIDRNGHVKILWLIDWLGLRLRLRLRHTASRVQHTQSTRPAIV